MQYTQALLATVATLAATVSAVPTTTQYYLYVPSNGQNLSVTLVHSGAGMSEAALTDPANGPGSLFYFSGGHLYSPAGGNEPPFGITFEDVGDGQGFKSAVYGEIGSDGRDDWEMGSDGSVGVPLEAALNTFLQCEEVVEGGEENSLFYGNPNTNGSLPEGCSSTAKIYATPASSN